MPIATFALALLLTQQPAPGTEVPVIKAGLGSCGADFTVKDTDGKAVYAAAVHVRVRYGVMSLKRMDLEVSTNSDGKATVDGLPAKSKLLVYDIQKDGKKATAEQSVIDTCQAKHAITLK